MQEVVVDEVPAPTFAVVAEQCNVAVALQLRRFRRDADNGDGAQRTLPPDLPAVAAIAEADLTACAIGALRHRVAVEREAVALDIDVARAVVRVPRVVERSQPRLVRWDIAQHVRLERLLGKLAYAVQPPDVVVLVVEEPVPAGADERARPHVVYVEV